MFDGFNFGSVEIDQQPFQLLLQIGQKFGNLANFKSPNLICQIFCNSTIIISILMFLPN